MADNGAGRKRRVKETPQERYERWWLGKLITWPHYPPGIEPRRVIAVELQGPPSFVTGNVLLTFEDGSTEYVPTHYNDFRPYKRHVIVHDEAQP